LVAEALLALYSISLAGVAFATWFFAFEIRKTFRGGIFWNAWRVISASLLFFMANQLVVAYEAVYGSTFAADAVAESFDALAALLLLVGFYLFYKAWNPPIPLSDA
jgi:hypothetical protein